MIRTVRDTCSIPAIPINPKASFETTRRRVTKIAQMLEDKSAILAAAEQLGYLTRIQESEFWEGIDLI